VWPKGVSLHVTAEVPTKQYEPRPTVVVVPPQVNDIAGLAMVPDAIEAAKEFCESDFSRFGKRIKRLRMKYDSSSGRFFVLGVEYVDGSQKSFS
jgi:hypothetical protein